MAQSKLQLIQENRAAWMSYLDAARAATKSLDVNSDENRLARLEASWQGSSRASQNLQIKSITSDALSSIDALTSSLWNDISSVESWNPDAPISTIASWWTWAKTVQELASAVSPTAQSIWTQATRNALSTNTSVPSSATNTQWNTSTIKWSSAWANWKQTTYQVIDWQTNKVAENAIANYDTNNTLDKTQYEQQKLAAEAKAMEVDTELKRKEAEVKDLALEEDRIQKQKAAQEAANMQALQEKERAANEASVAAAQAKADAAERELQIANDIELQKSNVAFAKMWLTLSTAAVTSAQQIYTTWIYNLSKLKSENAFKMADLKVAVAKVEFDHTKVINDIINNSSEKSYEIRKKLNDDIHTIKNSIIDNRFERQKNIDKAIDTYQEAIKANEDEVLDKMNKANDVLNKNVQWYYDRLKSQESYAKDKIDTFVTSGKWYAMSPIARSSYEKQAGLPTGTVARQIQAAIWTKIYTQAQEITWLKWVTFSSAEYNSMLTEAQRLVEIWVPLDTAINQAVTRYISKSPEYQAALAKARKAWMTKAWWSGGSSYGTTQAKEFYIEDANGNKTLVSWQYQPWSKGSIWRYLDANGNPITSKVIDIWEDTTSSNDSYAERIRKAIETKKKNSTIKK